MKNTTRNILLGFALAVSVLALLAAVPSQTDFDGAYFKTNTLPISLTGNLTDWQQLGTNSFSSHWVDSGTSDATLAGTAFLTLGKAFRQRHILVYGDSISVGYGASTPANCWFQLLTNETKCTATTNTTTSDEVGTWNKSIWTSTVTNQQTTLFCLGIVDGMHYTNAAQLSTFEAMHLGAIASLAVPPSSKILGNDVSQITYTGAWTGTGVLLDGKNSHTQGDTATFSGIGNGLIVGVIAFQLSSASGGDFSITVDGVPMTVGACHLPSDFSPSAAYTPICYVIEGLNYGPHTATITVTSATVVGKNVYLEWAAFTGGMPVGTQPQVHVVNTLQRSAASYAASGGSITNTALMNEIVWRNVSTLARCGLSVSLVNWRDLVDLSVYSSDGVHPNDAGHRLMADEFERLLGLGQGQFSPASMTSVGALMPLGMRGNVGIATNAPSEKLEVLGNIKASGQVIAPSFQEVMGVISHAGTSTLDFTPGANANKLVLTGAVTIAFSNLETNRYYHLMVANAQATNCSYVLPAVTFMGYYPTNIVAGKTAEWFFKVDPQTNSIVYAKYVEQQ